jgi:hypothetical protein
MMPTRSTSKQSKATKKATRAKARSPQAKAAATRKKNAARREAERAAAVESTAAATVHYEPAPLESSADPSKAPGKQHRHPPMNFSGVKHSEAYIAKTRTPFIRRMTMGR